MKINTLKQDEYIIVSRTLDNGVYLHHYDNDSFEGTRIKLTYDELFDTIKALRVLFYAYDKEPIQLPFIIFKNNKILLNHKQLSKLMVELILLKLEIKRSLNNETS
jgi:hypothetical protein